MAILGTSGLAQVFKEIATYISEKLSNYNTKDELDSKLDTKANDSNVVHNSSNETIGGVKTFSSQIVGSIDKAEKDLNGNIITSTYATKSEIPTKVSDLTNDSGLVIDVSNKADKSTTLSGYGITDAYTKTQVDTKLSDLVSSAPETLDTLNELASALGNDPNFATTIANQIGTKANASDLSKYLPLRGGTLSGNINFSGTCYTTVGTGSELSKDRYVVTTTSGANPGGALYLYGGDFENSWGEKGNFRLVAQSKEKGSNYLLGTPSGSLTWNDKELATQEYVNTNLGTKANSSEVYHYGVCSTAAATSAKVVSITDFVLKTGATVFVKFTVNNTATNNTLTLNVNNTGAKKIFWRGAQTFSAGFIGANRVLGFVYDGTNWEIIGELDTNTDTKTTQTVTTTNATYPILMSDLADATANRTSSVRFGSGVKINPSTSTIYATTFSGDVDFPITAEQISAIFV